MLVVRVLVCYVKWSSFREQLDHRFFEQLILIVRLLRMTLASFDGKILCFCQGVNCAGSRSFSLSYALKLISSPAGF